MKNLMPRDFTVYGIQRFGITLAGPQCEPLQENTEEYTALAFAIHAGISILEKAAGRQTMASLGTALVQAWLLGGNGFRFHGDQDQMAEYVDEFLRAIRGNFPRVILDSLGGPDVIAEARRIPCQNHSFSQYNPKRAGGIYYNRSRVSQMASAGREANETSPHGRKMAARFRTFLFMFAIATAHELTHLFVGYLAQGQDTTQSYTPPTVSYLNYAGPSWGESGRWLESHLFGGSVEFYRDKSDDDGQAGIPYVLDSDALARKIQPTCVLQLVTSIGEFHTFPFTTTGKALTAEERRERGLLSMGSEYVNGPQAGATFMRSRWEGPAPLYDISASELCRVPLEPRRVLMKIRVV
ncbi:Hypothetical protein NCS54_00322700 [Fusarium falciforme]|uniref:Hypothetical protein n=1 Tax=Fusarium falciforme TaxID=195108 RepID=UPI002301597B|nr:Hypothetical protein NCS54_00322700 [Fusarium falciforme]WAO85973.1 Hypothetical protein NCS54_00322700 [Fusarium falciforme]